MNSKSNPLDVAWPSVASTPQEDRVLSFDGPEARLNVTLPKAVHARVKIRAAQQGMSIRTYILTLLAKDGVEVGK